jgi:opacity protein-like surface antigen
LLQQRLGEFMKKYLLAGSAVALALGIIESGPAMAAPPAPPGLYVGAFGGVGFLQDVNLKSDVSGGIDLFADERKLNMSTGFSGGAFLGYAFGMGFRLEGEASYRRNSVKSLTVQGEGKNDGTYSRNGHMAAFAVMGNGWYDFGLFDRVSAHVGGGIGVAFVTLKTNNVAVNGGPRTVNDTETVFAYQAGGGFAYDIGGGVMLGLDYRYFATLDPNFKAERSINSSSGKVGGEYRSHNVLVSLRVPLTSLGMGR